MPGDVYAENRQEVRQPSELSVPLETHLVMNGIKSGFNVKDLIDLQDGSAKDKALVATTTATTMPCQTETEHSVVVEYHPAGVLMEHLEIAQQSGPLPTDTTEGSDHLSTGCVQDPRQATITMAGDVIVNSLSQFEQDNLYTRWLQNNSAPQYTSK